MFFALYGIGWCLFLAGLLCFPIMRKLIEWMRMQWLALLVGVGWWVLGPWRVEVGPHSAAWPIAAVVSLAVAFLGLLSRNRSGRFIAFLGLISMTGYGFLGKPTWFQLATTLDPRFMIPLLLYGGLAWTFALALLLGYSQKFGSPIEDPVTKSVDGERPFQKEVRFLLRTFGLIFCLAFVANWFALFLTYLGERLRLQG